MIYLSRLFWLTLAIAIALLAALFFHRFDPAFEWRWRRKSTENGAAVPLEAASASGLPAPAPAHLTPAVRGAGKSGFPALVLLELKLLLKGRRWWWYAVAAGLLVASIVSPMESVRGGVAVFAAIWPVLLWSQMGSREARCNTTPLVFSAERALWRQLPAAWIAGVVLAAATNCGLALRLSIVRDGEGLLAWLACTMFVPSLALALGVWSGSSKTFEALYTVWWYVGPAHHTPGADFLGTSAQSARPLLYLSIAAMLVAAAFAGRRLKLAYA